MSDYYDVKKLCSLSRLEMGESEFQKTADKIKEIITFFNKLDEFDTVMNDSHEIPDNYIKMEKSIDDLREISAQIERRSDG